MLQGASIADRGCREDLRSIAWRDDANAWLDLSGEASLGFGDAQFLSCALARVDTAGRRIMLYLTTANHRPASIQILDGTAALAELSIAGASLGIVGCCDPAFLDSLGFDGETPADVRGYYFAPELVALAEAGINADLPGRANSVYRAAKGMELVCETLRQRRSGDLIPICGDGCLSMADSQRVLAAKAMIAERFSERLTLASISRACGLNRTKLTKGFREMFNSSISETITEYRLLNASTMLTASDHPVSSVGYATGYLNNASFARAFHRRFGLPPSEYRAQAKRRGGTAKGVSLAA